MKEKVFIGIDPGAKGAVAVIGHDLSSAIIYDCPDDVSSMASIIQHIKIACDPVMACIEEVHALPGQGVSSSFSFGDNFGEWKGICAALDMPFCLVGPRKWQKFALDSFAKGDSKAASLDMARRIFPSVDLSKKSHDGRADALHLARYAMNFWKSGGT